jgi:hypothetical protein
LQIRGASAVLLLSTAALVAWAFQNPVAVDDQADLVAPKRAPAKESKLVGSPPLEALAVVWERKLRRPLDDPPKEQQENKNGLKKRRRDVNPAGGSLRLVGTMLENGRSVAIFTDATGKVDFKGVGEMLEISPGLRVDQIEFTQVTISEQGRTSVFQLPDLKVQ